MNHENLQNETEFRRFLLGDLTEEERSKFEENFIVNEELFENLRVVEDELIESYLRGMLEISEKTKFEANFLTTKKRRERVEFTRQMLAKLQENKEVANIKKTELVTEKPSFFASILAIFKQPGFAIGTAFAILLLSFGGWFWWRNSTQPIDIVKNTPTPQISVTPTPIANNNTLPINSEINPPNKNINSTNPTNQVPKAEPNTNKNPNNTNTEKTPETPNKPVISTLALFTGGVRSEGKLNELNLPKNSGGANLQLNLESEDYKIYRAEIVDQDGKVVYRSGKLTPRKAKLFTFIPAQNLPNGDYLIKVYGKNAQNQDESAADFPFRILRK